MVGNTLLYYIIKCLEREVEKQAIVGHDALLLYLGLHITFLLLHDLHLYFRLCRLF